MINVFPCLKLAGRLNPQRMKAKSIIATLSSIAAAHFLTTVVARSASVNIPIVNPGFETGTAFSNVIAGWTLTSAGGDGFWLSNFSASPTDPAAAHSGSLYLSANRLVPNPDAAAQPISSTLSQTVALAPASAEIAIGTATFDLSFYYSDADALDGSQINMSFFDAALGQIGATISFGDNSSNGTSIPGTPSKTWELRSFTGGVPVGATTARIDLVTNRYGGSATNISYDDFSLTIVPEPAIGLLAAAGLLLAGRRNRK